MFANLVLAFCEVAASIGVVAIIAVRHRNREFPTPVEIQRREERRLREYLFIRDRIEKDLVKLFRKPGGSSAKYESQPCFTQDNYEQIIHRVSEEETVIRGIWDASEYSLYSQTMFRCAVMEKANEIILERLKAESDRMVRASIDLVKAKSKGKTQEEVQEMYLQVAEKFCGPSK
jgi:hypothetical protein